MIDADGRPLALRWDYDRAEVIADGIVHGIGITLGVAGVVAMLVASIYANVDPAELAAIAIYSVGILAVLCTSAAYNLWPISRTKWILRRFDHACIFVLIAGTYTPFITQLKNGVAATLLFIGVWSVAIAGAALKLALPGRLDRAAIAAYLLLGASGLLAYDVVAASLPASTIWLIAIGGLIYAAGVPFHMWEGLRFQNAVWHVFVLVATACFYSAVLSGVVLGHA
jgi:hemolysin III